MTGPDDLPDERLLRQVMADVRDLIAREGWQPTIGSRMAMLIGETLELAEEILPLTGGQPPDDEALRQRIGHEMYDVLWNLCDRARLLEHDRRVGYPAPRRRQPGHLLAVEFPARPAPPLGTSNSAATSSFSPASPAGGPLARWTALSPAWA